MKKIALLCCLITLVGAFVFSGCSNDKPLLTKARENIHEVKSLSYNTETATIATLTENGQVEEINFVGAGTNKTTLEPLATSKYLRVKSGDEMYDIIAYGQKENNSFVLYTNTSGTWQKSAMSLGQLSALPGSPSAVEICLQTASNLTPAGEGVINGRKAVKYTGSIKGATLAAFNQALPEITEQIINCGLEPQELSKLYQKAEDVKVTFWLDQKSFLPLQYDFDMVKFMQSLVVIAQEKGITPAGAQYDIEKAFTTITFTGYNNVDSIEVPSIVQEAVNIGS